MDTNANIALHGLAMVRGSTGYPYPDKGTRVEFSSTEIVAFGRLTSYGDFVVRCLVRLADGREVFVFPSKLGKEAKCWLTWWFSRAGSLSASREIQWRFFWEERETLIRCLFQDLEVGERFEVAQSPFLGPTGPCKKLNASYFELAGSKYWTRGRARVKPL